MIVLGIDPGMNGAMAVLDTEGSITLTDIPTMGEDSRREINGAEIFRELKAWPISHAWIELVTAMPSIPGGDGKRRGMGSASAFRFGMGIGAIRACIQCAGISYSLVTPKSWKKRFNLLGNKDKEASRQCAIRMFPQASEMLARKKDHQRAEALLIAKYGLLTLQMNNST